MENNLLLSKMHEIQKEYGELLEKLVSDLDNKFRGAALDEIVLFWIKNKPIVNLFLRYYLSDKDAFVMTAVTYLDVDMDEQYPFLLLGNMHILDDPLGKYCEICGNFEDEHRLPLSDEVLKCAKDDIKVLAQYPQIIVIPLRLFGESEKQNTIKNACEQLFLSLFPDIHSLDEYREKVQSVQDISDRIKGFENQILLWDNDDFGQSFNERFEKVKPLFEKWFPGEVTDGQGFFLLINSYISQALDIILACSEYSAIPYIRYNLALHYYLLCSEVLERESVVDCRKKYVFTANLIYKIADIGKLKSKGDKVFFRVLKDTDFWELLRKEIDGVSIEPGAVNRFAEIIEKNLERLYQTIEKEEQ